LARISPERRKVMKKSVVLLAFAGLLLFAVGLANADPTDHVWSHVFVKVDPNIALRANLGAIDMGAVQTGDFSYDIPFRVDANTQSVKFMAGVSKLFKGDDPLSEVLPIDINLLEGVGMKGAMSNPTGGHAPVAAYAGAETDIEGFPGMETEWVTYESSQLGHFSQYFTLTPTWNQPDAEKPMGEYSGNVELWGMVVP
jgi:hypothetical protein